MYASRLKNWTKDRISVTIYLTVGDSPSGKAVGSGPTIRGFESLIPSQTGRLASKTRVLKGSLGVNSTILLETRRFETRKPASFFFAFSACSFEDLVGSFEGPSIRGKPSGGSKIGVSISFLKPHILRMTGGNKKRRYFRSGRNYLPMYELIVSYN